MDATKNRLRDSFETWRRKADELRRIKEIQRRFLTKLLMSKAGRVAEGFKKMKELPEIVDLEKRRKAMRFEKGLSSFLDKTLRVSFNAYRSELDEGQAVKKRAVIQLVNTTMGGQKKMYQRWYNINDRTKLLKQCRALGNAFNIAQTAIRSVTDNAFSSSKDNAIKEKSLTQLFKNLSANVGDSFKRWRDLNNIEKLREAMDNQQKASVLKVLDNLLNSGKKGQIRDAINKFKLNRRIT